MTQTNLERWIETAEARQVCERTMLDRMPAQPWRAGPYVGAAITKMPALIADLFSVPAFARVPVPALVRSPDRPAARH